MTLIKPSLTRGPELYTSHEDGSPDLSQASVIFLKDPFSQQLDHVTGCYGN
jgi:hypothetical protein